MKFAELGRGVLTSGGSVANKVVSLKNALDRNSKEQTRVNERATLVETRLKQRYSVLDAQMGQLTALNAYVTQQVTLWNRSTG